MWPLRCPSLSASFNAACFFEGATKARLGDAIVETHLDEQKLAGSSSSLPTGNGKDGWAFMMGGTAKSTQLTNKDKEQKPAEPAASLSSPSASPSCSASSASAASSSATAAKVKEKPSRWSCFS
jgi:hypothetical protein